MQRVAVRLGAHQVGNLHFRAGFPGVFILRGLLDVENEARIGAGSHFPVELQVEVLVLLLGDEIREVGIRRLEVAIELDRTVDDAPVLARALLAERMPAMQRLAVEEGLPALRRFGRGQDVVRGEGGYGDEAAGERERTGHGGDPGEGNPSVTGGAPGW